MEETMKQILMVEDDPSIIDIYAMMMKKAQFNVEVLSLGQEAIKKMKGVAANEERKPDIVLLDLLLPDIDGIEILREIKSNPATKDIKVFIMTNAEAELQRLDDVQPDKLIIKANTPPTKLIEIIKEELSV